MTADDRANSVDPLVNVGLTRTDMHCHACTHDFYAVIDYDLEGDQEIECPWCGHIHYRGVKAGKVTEARYNSDPRPPTVSDTENRVVWKAKTVPIASAPTAHSLIRNLWHRKEFN